MIKANGSLTLKADAEYGRFQIKCSAGETIPVDASGAPVGQVVFTFYKLTTEGTMTAFTAAKVFYELLDADGDSLYDDSLNSVARLDITADLKSNKGQVSSVNVIVYDSSNVMLANQSFGISMPGADAEVYLLSLTEGHYLVDSDGNVDAKLAGFLYKKTGGSTVGVAGARVDIGYVNGISANTTTKSDGSWTDDDYFKGDKYNDPDICNSSPAIFARYELNGVVEATQYVSLGQQGPPGDDGQDGTSYEIVLNTGATVPCTAYAELKTENLIVRLLKDGTAVNFEMFYVELQDEHETVINRYTGTHSNESYDLSSLFMSAIEGGKAPYYIYTKAYVGGKVVTEKTFSVTYETPFPFVRRETEWSAGLTFRNGDILILGAEYVYRWSYPISGNSDVDPQTDVANNKETTHWNAYSYYDMVATRILLAEQALLAGWVFHDNKLFSQNGNCFLDGLTGHISVTGIIKKTMVGITADNIADYIVSELIDTPMGQMYYMDITKAGTLISVETNKYNGVEVRVRMPTITGTEDQDEKNDARSYIGTEIIVYSNITNSGGNVLDDYIIVCSGVSCIGLAPGRFCHMHCILTVDEDGNELIYWEQVNGKTR